MRLNSMVNVAAAVGRYHAFRKRTPLIVSYLATYRCNQQCTYCDSNTQAGPELTTDQAITMLTGMRRLGTFKVGFTGGECLVREDIDELLAHAHSLGLVVSVSTNGQAVPEHLEAISQHVDLLQVSIDGPRDLHDRQRGSGSYDAAVAAVRMARHRGIKTVVNTVLTESTVQTLPHMFGLARELDVRLLFQPVFEYILSAPGPAIDHLRPRQQQFREAIRDLIGRKHDGEPIGNSYHFLRYLAASWPTGGKFRCLAGQLFCAVDPEGNVMPCCFLSTRKDWPNAVRSGVAAAFSQGAGRQEVLDCTGCYCNAYIESSAIFSLNPDAMYNALAIMS